MIIDCISDLHGEYPKLEGGDLLIVAGDLTASDKKEQYIKFIDWMDAQNYKRKVVIGGNHDGLIEKDEDFFHVNRIDEYFDFDYLCDSGCECECLETYLDSNLMYEKKVKIWGTPWTLTFPEINPRCTAFTGDETLLAEKFALIPADVDILISHGPPFSYLDAVDKLTKWGRRKLRVGSKALYNRISQIDDEGCGKRRLLICGHIHEGHGSIEVSNMIHDQRTWKIVNCSHMDENYIPINQPVRIIW